MSVVPLPRPFLPDSTLYAFPHDCDDYGPLPAFIQLPKARDDNNLKQKPVFGSTMPLEKGHEYFEVRCVKTVRIYPH